MLLEKIQTLFAVYTNTFDQSHIFNLNLLQNMSLHFKYIIQAAFLQRSENISVQFCKNFGILN